MSNSPSERSSSPELASAATEADIGDDALQFQQIIRDRKYEREDIQKKAFTKWINNRLAEKSSTPPVNDLFQDLRDGVTLLQLLEVLTKNECKRENGKMRVHHIENVNKVISILNEHGIKLLSISSNDIVDGNPKLTLALIWSIIQYWQGKDVMKSVEPDAEQTNIEKFLLAWCQEQTKGYQGVQINDFTRSWQDGLAFNALIHKFRPDLFDYDEILPNASARNLEHAFSVAKNVFKIDRYLDVEDVTSDYPDKKSILMYVMCLFQQLPTSNIIIEEKEKTEPSVTTTISDESTSTETKTSTELDDTQVRSDEDTARLELFQSNMEKILQWVVRLEEKLDQLDTTVSDDLKIIKEQFQNHEDFMINLTQDQNQIGEVLLDGNQLLVSSNFTLRPEEADEIKEKMKVLNDHWESLRSKSLDRQAILHKALMKLQIDQIESFDGWLTQTERRITDDLETLGQNLPDVNRQYQQLAELQDELVSQQQITESLQNMIIVIDDSLSDNLDPASKYTSTEIESKLLSLSERWAQICNFVQSRWIQLQEVKIEFEQVHANLDKVEKWLTTTEEHVRRIETEAKVAATDTHTQHVQILQQTESEMADIRQSILLLDSSLQVLSRHYDGAEANEFKLLSEQIGSFEKRWSQLIDGLERCSATMKPPTVISITSAKSDDELTNNKVTTTIEETTTTTTTYDSADESTHKKQKTSSDNTARLEFDVSARKYFDWIDSIERILSAKPSTDERRTIIQDVKVKYASYDEQFKSLLQTGVAITKELKEAKEDPSEHESAVNTLETRWRELSELIVKYEKEIDLLEFNDELQALTTARNEYQTWLNSTSSNDELQVKLASLQTYGERLANLRRMADHFDGSSIQRTDELLRSWDETHSRLRERSIPVEHMQQQSSGISSSHVNSFRQTGVTTSVPVSPARVETNEHSVASTTTTSNLGPSIGENGSVFTLTNIYTFGGSDANSIHGLGNGKDRVRSFGDSYNQSGSEHAADYERHYRESHVSETVRRKVRTSATDTYEYDYQPIGPTSRFTQEHISSSGTGNLSLLPSTFVDIQTKLRLWLEHVEESLLSDKVRVLDIHAATAKKKAYKDLLDQTFEQEHNLKILNDIAQEYCSKLTVDISRRLQGEFTNYQERLYDIKMFLSERLAKYNRLDKTLSDFESGVEEVKHWIRNAQPRLATSDTSSRGLENQLGRNQALQHEIRETQITINRLNKDLVDLTHDADETLARRLRDEMNHLNESWSHIVSSTKTYSQNIQDTLKRNRVFHDEIRELDDWIGDRERALLLDDGAIFHQEQLRERLDQYQRLQNELSHKEHAVRTLADQTRHELFQSPSPELAQSLETLVSNWSNLQKKVDMKAAFYSDVYKLHEELRDLIFRENAWLDTLQSRIYTTSSATADAEETTDELDNLERFVKSHSKINYEKILEISERLQSMKVSLTTVNSQINQLHLRWEQLHEDAIRRIHSLGSQVSEHQQLGQQISAMFEWMRHTDNTLNARLKDDVYADDLPDEADKLNAEFNQHEAFLRALEERIHALRVNGKSEAARRLEQQLHSLKTQFGHLQSKFRQFQRPSDFGPKYLRARQVLQDIEQNLHLLEVRSDDADVVHNQLEQCLKFYKTLSDVKTEVEYVIRVGRGIVEKGQTHETHDLTRQIDQLKSVYNALGAKVSSAKGQLDSVERHLRKFRKEYSHIHEWYNKADHEIRKIENKQVSKNNKEEVDWIRTTRNDIRKLEANFESLRSLERTIQKDAERHLPGLQEKISELRRQVDQLDRRLRDRSGIVEDQVRRLEDDYQRFTHIYQSILIRLDKLESLLLDAERVLDLTRISQVQEELRSVRTQLDEILNLGQELVSKSEKYSRLVGPDIETITRKFEELQHRIQIIQDRTIRERPDYEEIETIIRETEERAYIIEKTDVEQARRIREKISRLRECLESLKARSEHYQNSDEVFRFNERWKTRVQTTERTVVPEREFDSDFIFDVDDARSVISEPASHHNIKYRKTVHSLERYPGEYHVRQVPAHEEYQLQPLLRVRSMKAIDHRTLSAPSSPILQPRYRSYERSNVQYTKQSSNQQGYQDNYQTSISKSASMPNGGFPLQQTLLPQPPPPPNFYPQQPMTYRERIIDKHVAERSTSRGESHRQHRQESSSQVQQQQQQHQQQTRSASASGQTQTLNRSIPVRYESAQGNGTIGSSHSFRQASGSHQEDYPSYFHTEQQGGGGGGGGGVHRQQFFEQQTYSPQSVGRHPTRIAN